MTQWLTDPLAQDMAMTLVHSVWQGAVLAGMLYGLLNCAGKIQPMTRYLISTGTLVVLVLCIFGTLAVLRLDLSENSSSGHTRTIEPALDMPDPIENAFAPGPVLLIEDHVSDTTPWQAWALCAWAAGACLMLMRMLALLVGVHRLTRQCVPLADPAILTLIESLKTKLRVGRRILVVTGDCILSPGVIGFFRPILLVPASLATGAPREDLEAIVLHELAHILRYDYLVNFFQMVVESLLFFSPAVWWINRQIRLEREACCDAVAVSVSGQRLRYAEILMQWSSRPPLQHNQVAAMTGFSTPENTSLAERIKRIVLHNHKPHIHLTWLSLVGMLALTFLLFTALWKTTDSAVVFAARILTPAQRAETIDHIDQNYGAQAARHGPEDHVTIKGTVRAADGSDLPDDFYMSILGQSPTISSSSGTRVKKGRFEYTMQTYLDSFYLVVDRLDFAPAFVGPFYSKPGATIDNIDVVLTQGFPGVIQVVNEQGDPVEGAVLSGHYSVFKNFWSGSQKLQDLGTDSRGRVLVEKAITRPMTLDILAQGYQYVRNISVTQDPNQPTRLVLVSSTPTTGTILDDRTGRPIQGASLRVYRDHTNQLYAEGRGDIWATTDTQGHFSLSTLHASRPYTFIIETTDHQFTRIKDIAMGETDQVFRLKPKHHIRGHVLGEPQVDRVYDQSSHAWQEYPILRFSYGFEDEYTFRPGQVRLSESDGQLTFDITDVFGDTIKIETGDKRLRLKCEDKDVNGLVIDLRPASERLQGSKNGRTVVLQFDPPTGIDCNETQVSLSIISREDREAGHWGQWTKHTTQDNQIGLTVPAPGLLGYSHGHFDPHNSEGTFLRTFWIEGKSQIPVPPGDSPLVINVPLHPAGTIYGQINVPKKSLARHSTQDVSIQLLAIDKPDYMRHRKGDLEIPTSSYWRPSDKYALAPVPLGGTYVVVARYLYGWTMSQPIQLEVGRSIAQYNLDFSRGVDITGTILSDENQPMANMQVSLGLSSSIGEEDWRTGHYIIRTDHQGRFVFEGVNPDMDGTYSIKVDGAGDYESVDMKVKPRTRPYRIELRHAARVTGRIVDAQGRALTGLTVYANERQKRITYHQAAVASPSDGSGHFELKGLKHKTTYELNVQDHSLLRKIRIKAGQDTDVTLTVTD